MAKKTSQPRPSKWAIDFAMLRLNRTLSPEQRVEKAQAAARLMVQIRGLARLRP